MITAPSDGETSTSDSITSAKVIITSTKLMITPTTFNTVSNIPATTYNDVTSSATLSVITGSSATTSLRVMTGSIGSSAMTDISVMTGSAATTSLSVMTGSTGLSAMTSLSVMTGSTGLSATTSLSVITGSTGLSATTSLRVMTGLTGSSAMTSSNEMINSSAMIGSLRSAMMSTSALIGSSSSSNPINATQEELNDDSVRSNYNGGVVAGCVAAFVLISAFIVCLITFLIWHCTKRNREYITKQGTCGKFLRLKNFVNGFLLQINFRGWPSSYH